MRHFVDWASAHTYYTKCFDSGRCKFAKVQVETATPPPIANFSSTHIPRPEDLFEPPRWFLVVTRGEKIGIFDDLKYVAVPPSNQPPASHLIISLS